ncbi:MAG TPA: hypothetical protein VJP79_00590 [Nitrososphaera sp.]|nr:hypothetical protein [Nitrososphaera sp.]
MHTRFGTFGLIVLLVSAVAATTGLANIKSAPAFAHEEHSEFITNAEYIKGHLEQAIANKQAGRNDLAIAHANHPIAEVFALMKGPLEQVSMERAQVLEDALEALPDAVQSDSVESFTQKVDEVNGMLDEAIEVYAGEEAEELATKLDVTKALLETAGVEYSEAVEEGQITEMIEYQDASAFISRANATFETFVSEIGSEEAEEITDFFGQVNDSIAENAEPEIVQALLDGITHELEEAGGEGAGGNENVEFAANLAYIRGHLAQALANKQTNNIELAAAHAGHPVHEVYSLIESELAEHNAQLDEEIEQELTSLANEIHTMSEQQVQTEVANLNTLLDAAESEVINGTDRDDPAFGAMVAIAVLETAEHEYEEAIENGQITEMIEYQDSTAFIAQAKSIFESIEADMPEEEAQEVSELFDQLDALTASNASFDDVETAIDGLVHEFEEAFGLEDESQQDGQAYIDKIIELLDEAVASYQAGEPDDAKANAIEAYLDNYEFIESDIEEDDPDLKEKIEVAIRVDLVGMIEQARPLAEIQSHVDEIKADLEAAREIVGSASETPEEPEEEPEETPETTGGTNGTAGGIEEIIELLNRVNGEYIDAVENGTIKNQEEYDEAVLFIAEATEKFDAIKASLAEIAEEETSEVEDDLSSIKDLIDSMESSQQVSDKIQHAQAELREILEASGSQSEEQEEEGEQQLDGWGYIDRINELLDQSLAAYKEGSYEDARNLAREAYLDNYEQIEQDIEQDDKELMEEIEIDMREDLVKMIDDRSPVSDVENHINQIKTNLETARSVVTPEFPFAIIAIAITMAMAVAIARFKGFSLYRSP